MDKPWLLAKSTFHPTVYSRPEQEKEIRQAIEELWACPGFLPGPDTDILGGIYRANRLPVGSGHFSESGQKMAAMLWYSYIWHALNHSSRTES
jgi:hypothetical protein